MHKILAYLKFVLSDSLVTYNPHNYSLIQENFNILLDAFLITILIVVSISINPTV